MAEPMSMWGGMPGYIASMFRDKKKKKPEGAAPESSPRDTSAAKKSFNDEFDAFMREARPDAPATDLGPSGPRDTPEARANLNRGFDAMVSEQGVVAPPKESGGDQVMRGISGLLGFVPKGGTRGDAADGFANIGRSLMGLNSVQQMENDYNQSIAPEKLRRALETGDVESIKRLDPAVAGRVQGVDATTYDTGRQKQLDEAVSRGDFGAAARIDPKTGKMIEDQNVLRDKTRREAATRAALALESIATKSPGMEDRAMAAFVQESPNLFNADELAAYQQGGVPALKAMLTETDAIDRRVQSKFVNKDGFVVLNMRDGTQIVTDQRQNAENTVREIAPGVLAATSKYGNPGISVIDESGNAADPYAGRGSQPGPSQTFGAPRNPNAGEPSLPGAPEYSNMDQGTGSINSLAGQPPMQGQVPQAQQGVGSLTQRAAAAEALVAGAKTSAQDRAKVIAEIDAGMPEKIRSASMISSRLGEIENMTDEQLSKITGLPKGIADWGAMGAFWGSDAAQDLVPVKGLIDAVRMEGFLSVKGAGQVTEAESEFAAAAIASLEQARKAGPEAFRREARRVQAVSNMFLETERARRWAVSNGYDFDKLPLDADGKVMALRDAFAAQNPTARKAFEQGMQALEYDPKTGKQVGASQAPVYIVNPNNGKRMVSRDGQKTWEPVN